MNQKALSKAVDAIRPEELILPADLESPLSSSDEPSRALASSLTDEFSRSGGLYVYVVLFALTVASHLFSEIELTRDGFVPFRSGMFVICSCAVFYWGITYSVQEAVQMSFGVCVIMTLVRSSGAHANSSHLLVELPLVGLFLIGLAIIPNLVPWMIEEDIFRLGRENAALDNEIEILREKLGTFQKEEMQDKRSMERRDLASLTSKVILLNGFARELQQAGSMREIINLLFHNLMKSFQIEEAALFVVADEGTALVINKVVHKQSEELENVRILISQDETLAKVMVSNSFIYDPRGFELVGKLKLHFLIPLVDDDQICAVYGVGLTRNGIPTRDDVVIIEGMTKMAEGAMEQLRIATVST